MNNIHSYLTEYDKDNISCDKIIYSEPYKSNNVHKISVYNSAINHPLPKIWLSIKEAEIVYISKKNERCVSINVTMAPSTELNKKLINYLDLLEKHSLAYIKTKIKRPNYELKSTVSKSKTFFSNLPIIDISLPFDTEENKHKFGFFDINNHKLDISQLKRQSRVALYIELNSIWIKDNIIGYNWNVLQIKLLPTLNFLDNCMFDCDDILPMSHIPVKNTPPIAPPMAPPLLLSSHDRLAKFQNNIAERLKDPTVGIKFTPSLQDLQEKLKSLNKTIIPKKEISTHDINDMAIEDEVKCGEPKVVEVVEVPKIIPILKPIIKKKKKLLKPKPPV